MPKKATQEKIQSKPFFPVLSK